MCLILFAYRYSAQYPLIVLANRDEFYERPSSPAHYWPQLPQLLAGKDLRAGGTWLGFTRQGRFAAITNYREPMVERDEGLAQLKSRGDLTLDYLRQNVEADAYLQDLGAVKGDYGGFNLLVGAFTRSTSTLAYLSNQDAAGQRATLQTLAPGLYGLSNHLLDSPWPKVVQGKQALAALLAAHPQGPLPVDNLLDILLDTQGVADDKLPDTGVGQELERLLAPRYIHSPFYGTRASTVLLLDHKGELQFVERNADAQGPTVTKRYSFMLEDAL